jgi:bacterioferritin-associated ferredoxin
VIVCICANVSESAIRDKLASGGTLEDLMFDLGVCINCRICEDTVNDLIKDTR